MLRVLIVTPRDPLGLGGVEHHVRETSTRIATTGARVEVLCADPGGRQHAERWHDGVLIRSVPAWPAKSDWCFAPGIWGEMAREDWDVIHVQSYHTLVAPLAMMRALNLRIPYCVTFHGGGHSSRWRNRMRRDQLRALRPLLARGTSLIALARFEIDLYSEILRLPRERFVLIPNGTEVAPSIQALSGDRNNGSVVASIGRLERYKGHHRVIAAFPRVLEQLPEARLMIVGNGPYESALRKLTTKIGVEEKVEFTSVPPGDREGMARLLNRLSLVVLMSDFETHPLVGLEAGAAGCRLLVADRAGLLELAHDGFARAIPLGSEPGVIGDAILQELAKPSPKVRPRLTTWDQCAEELLSLYEDLARRKTGYSPGNSSFSDSLDRVQ